jgi:hypothetical protein
VIAVLQMAYVLHLLGDMAVRRDAPAVERAAVHSQQALALAEVLQMDPLRAHCHLGLGTLYPKIGQSHISFLFVFTGVISIKIRQKNP